ncbi:MAG: hypothetical protein JWM73_2933 [Solirubrobacterales bacterium]|nr:hypothetical protein [Solirubrobacterales bacterium]
MTRCHGALLAALAALSLSAASAFAAPPEQQSPLPNVTGCDAIDATACLLPFPNDLYTKPADTPTGRQVDLSLLAMPRNRAGKPIDPTDWNRADGFSPGSMIITKIAGLDDDAQLEALGAPRIWNPDVSLGAGTPVAVIDAATGQKQMVWAELDHSIDGLGGAPSDRVLIIRPSKNFLEGHRYIVALRLPGLAADPTFKSFRDGGTLSNPIDEQRRAHFEDLFKTLGAAGIERSTLTQAWDFTVASGQNIAGRMLHIRDDAFAQLGDKNLADMKVEGNAPTFTLNRVIDTGCPDRGPLQGDLVVADAQCPGGEDGPIAYDVKGTMDVPCYLSTPACLPAHSHFVLDPTTNLPVQIPGNVMKVDFRCRIPKVAFDNPGTTRPSLYGHGLFGGYGEIGQGQLKNMMAEHNFSYCATAWAGMATEDVPNVATILTDASSFNTLADRVQQGMLNFLYLGRLMIHPDGLCSQAAFQKDGKCLLDTHRLFYDGNSQGGIIGGALTAVAPDFNRATLGVLGMNYSTLLTRSTDFGTGDHAPSPTPDDPTNGLEYAWPLYTAYPQFNERMLLFDLMQMLWDRAEPDGYAQHMTDDPYPNTPAHEVMLMAGYGDHQVSNYSAEVEARTIGAKVLKRTMLRPWRTWELDPWTGLDFIHGSDATTSSVLTVWDGGSRPSPLANVAQDNSVDDDPHEWVRNTFAARAMKSAFLSADSRIVDTCQGFCDTDTKSPKADYSADPLEGKRHP